MLTGQAFKTKGQNNQIASPLDSMINKVMVVTKWRLFKLMMVIFDGRHTLHYQKHVFEIFVQKIQQHILLFSQSLKSTKSFGNLP